MAPFWHRWSYFSIINLSVFHLADKCFTIANLINLRIILFLEYRKTPETQGFWGILRLDTTLSYDNKSIFRLYYSMIVATRPDPTVLQPSRTANQRPCPRELFPIPAITTITARNPQRMCFITFFRKTFYHIGFCRQNGSSSPFASRSSLFVNISFVSPSQTIRPPAIRITRLQVSRIISRSCDAMIFRCSKSFSI